MSEEIYPAITIVHWPGKDVPACLDHAAKLINIGAHMGLVVSATPVKPSLELMCTNCENEAKKAKS